MRVVYVIGLPGSGKTTVVQRAVDLLAEHPVVIIDRGTVPHVRLDYWLWHIGKPRAEFGGTDTLSMSIQPRAIRWLDEIRHECDTLVGEGDRLANGAFFAACPNLTIVYLDVPPELARFRANGRADQLGRPRQDEAWWKGRATKVANLVRSHRVVTFDGTMPAYLLAEDLADLLAAGSDSSQAAKWRLLRADAPRVDRTVLSASAPLTPSE